MAQLDTLPSELLQTILSFLAFFDRHKLVMRRGDADVGQPEDFHQFQKLRTKVREKRIIAQGTLRSLCLVSKRFQTLAEPFLYSSWKPYEETQYWTWKNTQDICLQQFLRTLITRNDLSHHVKYIELEPWRTHEELDGHVYSQTISHVIDLEDPKLFIGAAKEACVPRDTEWLSAIARGLADALVALLLTLVHNLEGLSVLLPYNSKYPEQIIAHAAFESVQPSLYSFPRFSQVSYAHGWGHLKPSDISSYFSLPAMRVIEGWGCVEPRPEGQKRWSLPRKKSKVVSIELSGSCIDTDSIATLLGACETLESLTLTRHFFTREQKSLAYLEVCRGLQSVQSSLKQFRLDTHFWRYDKDCSAPMLSFNTFPKLECLNLELDFLLGPDPAKAPQLVDVLPTSITSLILRYGRDQDKSWNRKRLAPLLQKLAQCSKDKFPHLKKVELIRADTHLVEPRVGDIDLVERRFDDDDFVESIDYEDWYL
ncbi:hypothetical protein MMC07_001080 [Pseudocyphellaria aurata]|nr:hypothetical protein [Pseudocyphellaria aurata]